jgi:riboflavin synthase
MFTGLIEETGSVESILRSASSIQLTIRLGRTAAGLKAGDSLAINGCCLTVVNLNRRSGRALARFDLLKETWNRTSFQFLRRGALLNLERPLRANSRLGGHFVSGHVDGLGKITRWERNGRDYVLDIAAPRALMKYIVLKGSIALDGISLTVAAVRQTGFRVWIIPHTFGATALCERKPGDAVNLETDVLAKYVEKLLSGKSSA